MDYGLLVGLVLALSALVFFAGLQLLRQVTRACMPHPILSDGDEFLSSCDGEEEAKGPPKNKFPVWTPPTPPFQGGEKKRGDSWAAPKILALDTRTQGVEARDGMPTGLGILFSTALGLWQHPVWLVVSLACGAYLVLSSFKKAPVELKEQQAVSSRQ